MSKALEDLCNVSERMSEKLDPIDEQRQNDATIHFLVCWFRNAMWRVTGYSIRRCETVYNSTHYNQVVADHDLETAYLLTRCVGMYDAAYQNGEDREYLCKALDFMARQESLQLRRALDADCQERGIVLEWA